MVEHVHPVFVLVPFDERKVRYPQGRVLTYLRNREPFGVPDPQPAQHVSRNPLAVGNHRDQVAGRGAKVARSATDELGDG